MTFNFINADWPAPKCIVAGTTTKQGGNSNRPYDGFNLATHVGDDYNTVVSNRLLLQSELDLPAEPIWLNQVHGTTVLSFTEIANSDFNPGSNLGSNQGFTAAESNCADAIVSFEQNTVCAVLTADCLPLLVTDLHGTRVAAIHAGWRGLRDGIIERTIATLNCDSEKLLVWIGPAISRAVFEVDDTVRDEFITIDLSAESAFSNDYKNNQIGHWLMDLVVLAKQRLLSCAIPENAIYGGNHCSYLEQDLFYSYRRNAITGRMASLIYIRNI